MSWTVQNEWVQRNGGVVGLMTRMHRLSGATGGPFEKRRQDEFPAAQMFLNPYTLDYLYCYLA